MKMPYLFLFVATSLALLSGNHTALGWYRFGQPGRWFGPCVATRMSMREHVPYYAKHPPVYYSRPISRPYGYYPYAYFPERPTPKAAQSLPLVLSNPFVMGEAEGSVSKRPPLKRPSLEPLRIVNPFADEPEDPLPTHNASSRPEPEA